MNLSWLTKTQDLLNSSDLSAGEIAEGAGVHRRWLTDLKKGRFSDPGINRVERVYNFLLKNNVETTLCKSSPDEHAA